MSGLSSWPYARCPSSQHVTLCRTVTNLLVCCRSLHDLTAAIAGHNSRLHGLTPHHRGVQPGTHWSDARAGCPGLAAHLQDTNAAAVPHSCLECLPVGLAGWMASPTRVMRPLPQPSSANASSTSGGRANRPCSITALGGVCLIHAATWGAKPSAALTALCTSVCE